MRVEIALPGGVSRYSISLLRAPDGVFVGRQVSKRLALGEQALQALLPGLGLEDGRQLGGVLHPHLIEAATATPLRRQRPDGRGDGPG